MKDLRKLTVDELKDIARGYGGAGIWRMTKDKLIAMILKSAELNGQGDLYFDSQEAQNEPYDTSDTETSNLSASKTEATEQPSNGWELIAKQQLKNAYDQIVGGYENSVTDGEMTLEEFGEWIKTKGIDEVYHEAITTRYDEDACGGDAPSEMRFAGKEFCYNYLETLFKRDGYKNASREPQNASGGVSESETDNYKAESTEPTERAQEPSNHKLKGYAAWVVDRETKEVTSVVADAESREDFYNSIKGKYRVRLITKPEKLEEECKQWEIKHAQNKIKKNEKYARDKEEANKKNMNVAEYRKWLRESAKTGK